jgi:hypothetical protein
VLVQLRPTIGRGTVVVVVGGIVEAVVVVEGVVVDVVVVVVLAGFGVGGGVTLTGVVNSPCLTFASADTEDTEFEAVTLRRIVLILPEFLPNFPDLMSVPWVHLARPLNPTTFGTEANTHSVALATVTRNEMEPPA